MAGTPPAGLILRSTFSSLADAGSNRFPWLPVRWLLWDRFSSAERIGTVTCPVLNLHGTEDRIVPFALGEKLFAVTPDLSANGIPKKFVPLNGADHNDVMLTHEREVTKAIDDFFAELAKLREDHNTPE